MVPSVFGLGGGLVLGTMWGNALRLGGVRPPWPGRPYTSGLKDEKDTGDSDDVYLEGEASRFRWLRAPATTESALHTNSQDHR